MSTQTPLAPLWAVDAPGKAFVDLQNDVTRRRSAPRPSRGLLPYRARQALHDVCNGDRPGQDRQPRRRRRARPGARRADRRRRLAALSPVYDARRLGCPCRCGCRRAFQAGAASAAARLAQRSGAVFVKIGLWLRPLVYSPSGDTSWEPVLAEARAVRRSVGVTDVSSLGKIDVQGPDAAHFSTASTPTPPRPWPSAVRATA